jgi:hypothetical protein
MTATAEGRFDGHGDEFMGIYLQLLVRYLRLDPAELSRSARTDGIEVKEHAQPIFVDVCSSPLVSIWADSKCSIRTVKYQLNWSFTHMSRGSGANSAFLDVRDRTTS